MNTALAISGWGASAVLFFVAAFLTYRDSGNGTRFTNHVSKGVAVLFLIIAAFSLVTCIRFDH